ncbi:MAG: peptidyl-prolyl cis-trans isomerase [Abditibacteriota bacterium]|nr:peptidyl-prolyl cis-trans isomerase [Abditibacteriota bacterium]
MRKIIPLALLAAALLFAGCNKDNGGAPTVKLPGVPKNVATVNGLNITSKDYQTYLHDNYGETALPALIKEKIIESWAKDLKVYPTSDDIAKAMDQLKEGPAYQYQSMQTEPDLLDKQISKMAKQQAVLVNIAKKLVPAKEEEMKKLYDQQKSELYQKPAHKEYTLVMLGDDEKKAKEIASQITGAEDEKAFIKALFELRKDNENVQAFPGMTEEAIKIDPSVDKVAKALKNGEWSPVSKMDAGEKDKYEYYVMTCKDVPAVNKSYEDVKDELEANVSINKLGSNDKFKDTLNKRMTDADIQIFIPEFADIADQIKKSVAQNN